MAKSDWHKDWRVTTFIGTSLGDEPNSNWIRKRIELPNAHVDNVIEVFCEQDSQIHKAIMALESALATINEITRKD